MATMHNTPIIADTSAIFGFDRQFVEAGYERLAPAGRELPDAA